MQYFRPDPPFFVGDCMPFFHDGTFHLIYLLDENHHQALGGLGGHQWAHASSTDLVHWHHHPLALPCDQDWEGSICTGSVFVHDGSFHAFYATRQRSDREERLSHAVSRDGMIFQKTQPNPFAGPPPGYGSRDFRDPFVFRDDTAGRFHMLVTAALAQPPLHGRGGCLAHFVSDDLANWSPEPPFLVPGGDPGYPSVPECPDYFFWNGWYYLIFSLNGEAVYRMSRQPYGPWLRPPTDTFDGPSLACVMKTAPFTGNRRIGVPYLASREGDRDAGKRIYAGHALFRELVQHADGTLGVRFPPEMTPGRTATSLPTSITPLTDGVSLNEGTATINSIEGMAAAQLDGIPRNARVTLRLVPEGRTAKFGLGLRGSGKMESAYYLSFHPSEGRVTFNDQTIYMNGLDAPVSLEIVMTGDILDICVNDCRCIVDRAYELSGTALFVFAHAGSLFIDAIDVRPIG